MRNVSAFCLITAMVCCSVVSANAAIQYRIDISGTYDMKGQWYNISNHGWWGQAQCQPNGSACNTWDWKTWWDVTASEPGSPIGPNGNSLYFDHDPKLNLDNGLYE